MTNRLGSLTVSLGLDAAEFTSGLSKAEYRAKQWGDNFVKSVELVRVAALGSAAGIGAAFVALDAQLTQVSGFQDLAEKMGDSAEAIASLKPASDLSGVSLETLSAASIKLTASLAKTDDESKGVALGLKSIGLELGAFKALSPVQQIDAVAKAMAGFEDSSEKTAAAVQIFGKSGAELLPLLGDLANGAERQITLTQAQIMAADEYSKATDRMRGSLSTFAMVASAEAAPQMTQMVKLLEEVERHSSGSGTQIGVLHGALAGGKKIMETAILLGSDLAFVFKMTGNEIGGMAAQLAALARGDLKGFSAISDAMKEDAERARKELDAFQARVSGAAPMPSQASYSNEGRIPGARLPRINTGGFGGSATAGAAKDPLADAKRYLEALEKQALSAQELSAFAKLQADIEAGRLGKLDAPFRKQLEAAAKAVDMEKQLTQEIEAHAKMREEAARVVAATQQEAARLYEATRSPAEKLNALEVTYQKMLDQRLISLDTYQRAVMAAHDAFEEATQKGSELVSKAADEGIDQAKRLGDAFSSTFDSAFKNGMKFGDLLKKLAFDAINIQFLTPAAQKAGGALGGIVSKGFGSIFSFDGGGYTGAGARSGGLDGRGGFMAMLHPNETVLDHTRGQGAANTIVQHITIDARGADAGVDARIRAAMAQTKQETLAAVQSGANRGGGFARSLGRA